MARIGSSFEISGPFVAIFKGDDGLVVCERLEQVREDRSLKIEVGITNTVVGYLVGDRLTLDLPRLANKAMCRTYNDPASAREYQIAVADWLSLLQDDNDVHHMIRLNMFHYGLAEAEVRLLWTFLLLYANGSFYNTMERLFRRTKHMHHTALVTPVHLQTKIIPANF
jgi:hypothetical protein